MLLPSCAGSRKIKQSVPAASIIDSYDIESVYKEQSLKEAALSALRRSLESDSVSDTAHITKKLEARLADVPIPLNARPIERYFVQSDTGQACIAYDTALQQEEAIAFYQREMERSGWQKDATMQSAETLFVYKKPGKIVTISLRPAIKRGYNSMIVIMQMMPID